LKGSLGETTKFSRENYCSLNVFQDGDDVFPKDDKGELIYGDTDYLDTWKGMEECVRLGLTKSIGVSNFNSEQLTRLLEVATIKPVTNQVFFIGGGGIFFYQ